MSDLSQMNFSTKALLRDETIAARGLLPRFAATSGVLKPFKTRGRHRPSML
jgi:hypothetical protein